VSLRSVQDWEGGVSLPSSERLRAVLQALLGAGGLTTGQELAQARELWAAVEHDAPRMRTPFDEEWFTALLTAPPPPPTRRDPEPTIVERAQDWGEAPDTAGFVGRGEELTVLQKWVLEDRSRLVAVLGMGGIGKTSLAAWAAQKVAPSFERVYWRSLRNAPPLSEWLTGAIGFLSDQHVVPAPNESEQISALLQLLRTRRCLLVLDNSETLFEPGQAEGRYRAGMDGYGRVLHAVGDTPHHSCLLLTSREAPPELAVLGSGVRTQELHGMGSAEAQALLADKQLAGDKEAWATLVDRYGGNGLALKMVGETIRQVFEGDVAVFLGDATYGAVFGGIRRLLDVQAERLSHTERDVLRRMAVEREPMSLVELTRDMAPGTGPTTVLEAVETLRRRSLVERANRGATFTLQSLVLEYVTDRLVETVADEITRGEALTLVEQPLIKAQAKDYVRQTQERLIGAPILQRLTAQHTASGTERRLLAFLDLWRGLPAAEQGYGPGSVVNLLRLLRGNLRGMDLSRLALRQVYLQGVNAQDATLAGSGLSGAVLDEAFAYPTAVALSADGAFLAGGTPTGELRLWRATDRTPLLAVQGHVGVVWSVALSADGKLVASSGADGLVRLWSFDELRGSGGPSAQLLATLTGHTGVVLSVALSSDGRLVASGGDDGTVRLWDAGSGEPLFVRQGHSGGVRGMAFSGDGRLVASGGVDGTIRLWDAQTGQSVTTLLGHTGPIMSMSLSQDGQLVASGGADGVVRLCATSGGQLLATLKGHSGAVLGVALSGDGQLAASGGADAMARVWETRSGQLLATLHGHTGVVLSVALSSDGRSAATASWDGAVRLWEAGSGRLVATLQGHTGMVFSVALSGDARTVASGGVDGSIRMWEAASGRPMATLQGHTGVVYGVRVSEDGRLVASGGVDGTVRLWDAGSGRLLATLQGHTGGVWCVALSADGRLIASGGVDGMVRLWEAGSRQHVNCLEGHTGLVWGVALSGDGRLVVSGGVDGTVRLWSFDELRKSGGPSGQLVSTLLGHEGVVLSVAVSADGQLVASSGADGTVRLWQARSGEPLASLRGHTGAALSVALSADGRLVASGGADGTARLWEAESGRIMVTLQGHAGVVSTVALSGDGRLLASGGDDGTVRLWDAASGASLHTLRGDRHYQRLDITGLTGVTDAQRAALLELGAVEALV
jgi:WD40 repeat protein